MRARPLKDVVGAALRARVSGRNRRESKLLSSTRPALDLSLGRNRIGDPIKPLREYQSNRTALRRVAAKNSSIVLGYSPLKT
jgi:hypothetical protein